LQKYSLLTIIHFYQWFFFIRAWTLPITFLKPNRCFDVDRCWPIKTQYMYIFHRSSNCVYRATL
jgi:hypothetical protein